MKPYFKSLFLVFFLLGSRISIDLHITYTHYGNMKTPPQITVHSCLVEATVSAGFPSPAESYSESPLDLNKLLIHKPQATFFVRVNGHSMIGAGIYNNDLLIVDRSLEPRHGQVVVAALNGEFTLKRLIKNSQGIYLKAENPQFSTLKISPECDFQIWGVAIYNIHRLDKEFDSL